MRRILRFKRLGKWLAIAFAGSAILIFAVRDWLRADVPVRVKPVGGITVMIEDLSPADFAQIKNVARRQMWRSNMSDLRQGGIWALPIVFRRQLSERMQMIEVQPNGSADVLTHTYRDRSKTSNSTLQVPRYSVFSRRLTLQKGTNGWQLVRIGLAQLE